MEGTVKWFNRTKGFGFINGEDGNEYFVHYSSLKEGTFIRDNDKVSFDAAETEKGKQAQNVVLVEKASDSEGSEEQGNEADETNEADEANQEQEEVQEQE